MSSTGAAAQNTKYIQFTVIKHREQMEGPNHAETCKCCRDQEVKKKKKKRKKDKT